MFCEGGCACGAVRYTLQTRPIFVHACHCLNCQRLTGGAFAVNAIIEKNRVALLAGEPAACQLKGGSGQPQDVYFCATCGTHVWNDYHIFPGNTWFVRVGTFDDPALLEPDVHIYTRQTQSAMHGIIEQLVAASTMGVLLPHVARRNPIVAAYLDSMGTDPRESDAPSGVPAMAVTDATEPASDDSSRSQSRVYQIIVPGYTVMFAFFLINIMARSFLAEQQAGTLLRLRIAPIHRWQVLIGKMVPVLIISIVQGVLLFGFGKLLFGMSWGPQPWLLLLVISCTSLAATGLGLVTAVCVRSDAQVSAYANLLVITLAAVSGCFMPRAWLPETMRQISLATPHAWSLIAYDQLLNTKEPDVGRVLLSSGVLVLFFLGLTGLGFLRFRKLSFA
ncbi:MAG: GFA family protein [SAR324 cluster bacterium]|nr:GFA family protein [SAR324 cluster bacterium]